LEGQDDADKEWRIVLLSAAAVCFDDDKQTKGASDYVDKAIELSEALLAKTLGEEEVALAELTKAQVELDKIMSAFHKIEEREELMHKPRKIDPDLEEDPLELQPIVYPPLEGLAAEGYDVVKGMLDHAQKSKAVSEGKFRTSNEKKTNQMENLSRLYMQRVFVNPADAKRFVALPNVTKYVRSHALVMLQCMLTPNCVTEKEWESSFTQLLTKLEAAGPPAITMNQRSETLLDICRTAWYLKQRKVALKCFEVASSNNSVSPILRTKMDVCEAIHMLADLNDLSPNEVLKQRLSKKQMDGYQANRRIDAVKLLERALSVCVARLNDSMLAQEICVIIWNACIPLMQSHLRLKVYSALKGVSNCLDALASPLVLLRTQTHLELAKCEEQSDFVAIAKEEGLQALHGDYGVLDYPVTELTMDRNRPLDLFIAPLVELLELRCNVFDSPADVEGKALMWIQQCKESKSKEFIVDTLNKCAFVMLEHLQRESGGANIENASGTMELSPTQKDKKKKLDFDDISQLDITLMTMKRDDMRIPEVSLDEIKLILNTPRSGVTYMSLNPLLQKRLNIMTDIARMAHTVKSVNVLQQAACFVLSQVWDPSDKYMFSLIDTQIQLHNQLADSILERISTQQLPSPDRSTRVKSTPSETIRFDPRSLGIVSDQCSQDVMTMKRLVILSLERGMLLAVSVKDPLGVQNAVVYLWNLHLHVFRYDMYSQAMDELIELVKLSITQLDALKPAVSGATTAANNTNTVADASTVVDDRLKLSMSEALAGYLEAKKLFPQAIECAIKAATGSGTEYMRKRVCEQLSKLLLLQQAAAAAAVSGTKGAKAPPPVEQPKYDSPFLSIFAALTQAEQPIELIAKETALQLTDKAVALLTGDLATYLASLQWVHFTQERFAQLVEMQTECWCRVTRLRLLFDDTAGAQFAAEKCLSLVAKEAMSREDEHLLPARVLRWMSVCERLFGMTVASMIKPDGQELSLQNELRLISLQHLTSACEYGIRAESEELILEAATVGWNVSMNLVDVSELRERLFALQRRVIHCLLQCKTPQSEALQMCMLLRQQFYLAVIEGFANVFDWTNALKYVMEAFEHVSADFQKPLWQWRVISMSKKGKSVLDGMQKLKETDPLLQAQVFAILARASNDCSQQLQAYIKAVEILDGNMERIEYMLECAQFMATSGLPRVDIRLLLQETLDTLLEVEGKDTQRFPGLQEMDDDELEELLIRPSDDNTDLSSVGPDDNKSVGPKTKGSTTSGKAKSEVSKAGSAASRASRRSGTVSSKDREAGTEPTQLNLRQLEQAMRALAMLAQLETTTSARMQRCSQAVYFIERSLQLWFATLRKVDMDGQYEVLAAGPNCPSKEEFSSQYLPPAPLALPQEPLSLIFWQPSHSHTPHLSTASNATDTKALQDLLLQTPSALSYPAMPLTCHYLLQLAQTLHNECGLSKAALQCLAFLRMLLLTLLSSTPTALTALAAPLQGGEAFLALSQLLTVSILTSLQLSEEAMRVPLDLPNPHLNNSHSQHYATNNAVSKLTLAGYVSAFIAQRKPDPVKKSEPISDRVNPFGFSTWTPSVDGSSFDASTILLQVAEELVRLGQVSLGESLGRKLLQQFEARSQVFASIRCRTLLAEVDSLQGQFASVASSLLSCRQDSLSVAGDPTQLGAQTVLLVRAFCSVGKLEAAKQAAESAFLLLGERCVLHIDRQQLLTSPPSSSSTTSIVRNSHRTSTLTLTSAMNQFLNTTKLECSREHVAALVEVTLVLVDALLMEMAYNGDDPRAHYMTICDRLSRVHDTVCDVCGSVSDLAARVLSRRATAGWHALQIMHTVTSNGVAEGDESYQEWLADNLQMCVEHQEQAVRVLRILWSCVSLPDRLYHYLSDQNTIPGAESALDACVAPPYKELSIPQARLLAVAELQLAVLRGWWVVVTRKHSSSGASYAPRNSLTAVQQYLEATQPPEEASLDFFRPSPLLQAISALSSAEQLVRGCASLTLQAQTLFHTMQCIILRTEGHFDSCWNPALLPGLDPTQPPTTAMQSAADKCRELLTSLTRQLVISDKIGHLELCSLALVEAYGPNKPAQAAVWLLTWQSYCAREWLRTQWLASLPPSSAVFASVRRLEALQRRQEAEQDPQQAAERLFLHTNSASYRRLSIAVDPAVAIQSLPAHTVLLCVHFCPLGRSLYVCAGTASDPNKHRPPTHPPAKGAPPAPGLTAAEALRMDDANWFFDKVSFSESGRRRVQALLASHRVWVADTHKFTAMFTSEDEEVSEGRGGDSAVHKAEKLLAGRFARTVRDMESLFSEVFGMGTEMDKNGLSEEKGEKMARSGVSVRLREFLSHLAGTPPGRKSELNVVLLLEPGLQSLPWEALAFFQRPLTLEEHRTGLQLSRDFSLPLLFHRLKATHASNASNTMSDSQPLSPSPLQVPVNASNFRYTVDPFHEDTHHGSSTTNATTNKLSMTESFETTVLHGMPGGRKWQPLQSGVKGHSGGRLSLQDWVSCLHIPPPNPPSTASAPSKDPKAAPATSVSVPPLSAVFVHTLGRLGSLLAPQALATLDFQRVGLLCVLDRSHTDASARRQVSADVAKPSAELALEQPLVMQALLALAGPAAVLAPAWSTPLVWQKRQVKAFWLPFTSDPASTVCTALTKSVRVSENTESSSSSSGQRKKSGASSRSNSVAAVQQQHPPAPDWIRFSRVLFGLPHISYTE